MGKFCNKLTIRTQGPGGGKGLPAFNPICSARVREGGISGGIRWY